MLTPSCACLLRGPTVCTLNPVNTPPCVCLSAGLFLHFYVPSVCLFLHVYVPSVRLHPPCGCPSVCLFLCMYIPLVCGPCVCPSVCLFLHAYIPSVCVSLHTYVPSVCKSNHVYVPLCPCFYRVYLLAYSLCVCPSKYLRFVCASVYLFSYVYSSMCISPPCICPLGV